MEGSSGRWAALPSGTETVLGPCRLSVHSSLQSCAVKSLKNLNRGFLTPLVAGEDGEVHCGRQQAWRRAGVGGQKGIVHGSLLLEKKGRGGSLPEPGSARHRA